jgi:hypothetical protein
MRVSAIATTLFATLVAAQDANAPAYTTSMQTWTLTKTVERVVETVTATRNTSAIAVATETASVSTPLTTASVGFIPLSNGTSTVLGTGTGAGRPGSVPTGLAESGADKVGLEMLGLMAVAGLVGFAGL